jgi:putative two-component system response regulator
VESSLPRPAESPVMLVDDDVAVLAVFSRCLERLGYPVQSFVDPLEARAALDGGDQPHLLVVDKEMPGLDGLALAQHAVESDPSAVAMIVTGKPDVASAVDALRLGVVDYLMKPLDLGTFEAAVRRALLARAQAIFHRRVHGHLRDEVQRKTAELERQNARLEQVTIASLSALVSLLEARSHHFEGHSQDVSRIAEAMARSMGLLGDEVEAIRVAGLLHDIGMIAVPDAILHKGEDLTPTEIAFVREHPLLAERVLRPFAHLSVAVDYVLSHHERLDGSGYPRGLSGSDVSLGAQIVSVADSYVALVESRAFRAAIVPEKARETLRRAQGIWFEARVLDALDTVTRGAA